MKKVIITVTINDINTVDELKGRNIEIGKGILKTAVDEILGSELEFDNLEIAVV